MVDIKPSVNLVTVTLENASVEDSNWIDRVLSQKPITSNGCSTCLLIDISSIAASIAPEVIALIASLANRAIRDNGWTVKVRVSPPNDYLLRERLKGVEVATGEDSPTATS